MLLIFIRPTISAIASLAGEQSVICGKVGAGSPDWRWPAFVYCRGQHAVDGFEGAIYRAGSYRRWGGFVVAMAVSLSCAE